MSGIKMYWQSVKETLSYSFSIAPVESIFIVVFHLVSALLPYATAWLLGYLVNTLIETISLPINVSIEIIWVFFAYAIVNGLPNFIEAITNYVTRSWRFKFQNEMEVLVLKKRLEVDIARYEDPAFQDLYQRAFQQNYWPLLIVTEGQFHIIRGLVSIIIGSILATTFGWKIYLILLLCSVPKFIAEYKYGVSLWSIWFKDSPEQRRFANLRGYFMERPNITETKLLQSSKYLLEWIKNILTRFNSQQLKAEKIKTFRLLAAEILALTGFVWAAFIILQDVLAGLILVGSMVYILSTLANVRNAFANTLSEFALQSEKYLIVKDLLEFFHTEPLIKKSENPVRLNLTSAPVIIFDNIGFKYPNSEKWVLKGLNLTITPGQKVGLVGNNGAGKTTLIKLLCRIYDPTEGRILINGVDLRELDMEEWWSYLGVMLQEYNHYDLIAKESIAIGRTDKELDLEEVKKAAEVSQSAEFIEKWDKKYDQPIGVEFSGVEPSKGQRQKLSIAKIIYRNAFVTILDEPTASVDAESEAKIFASLDNLSESMTAILISHDFSTIRECDKIFVLDQGMLKEEGSHDDLMRQNGLYAELFNLQAEGFK